MSSLYDSALAHHAADSRGLEPLPSIEAVLFDFSHTLFRLVDVETWLRRVAVAAGREAELDDDVRDKAIGQLVDAYVLPEVTAAQAGRDLSPERHRQGMYEWWRRVDFLKGIESVAYDVIRAADSWVPYSDAGSVLRSLCEQGVKVGIVSDFAWDLGVHLEHWGLDAWVDDIVISYQEGCEKPDPAMFLKACQNLDVDPRTAIMVGDNPTRDGGAAAVGMRTYILPGEPRNDDRGLEHVLGFLA
jgi:FMN phosphatase YigB (HAD superfamily)